MRRMIDLPETLWKELKIRAVQEGKSLKVLVGEILQGSFDKPEKTRTWPSRDEFRKMSPEEVNAFLESIGASQRVIEPVKGVVAPSGWWDEPVFEQVRQEAETTREATRALEFRPAPKPSAAKTPRKTTR